MVDDQEGDWREILQKWDEQSLSNMMNEQEPTCTSMSILNNSSTGLAMESLNPGFYSTPQLHNPSSMASSPCSMGFSPSPISSNQNNSALSDQPLMGNIKIEAALISDPLHDSSASALNTIEVENLISTAREQDIDLSGSNLPSSWLSTFLQSLQSLPAAHLAGGLAASPSSSHTNLLNFGDEHNRALAAQPLPPHGSDAMQYNSDFQQAGSSIEEILEQMSNDFINYGAAGSLQEHLSNALSASNVNLMMGSASMSTAAPAGVSTSNKNIYAKQTNIFSTPASSVSSDGGPDDDSSSHEDTSNIALDPLDDFIMQSGGPLNNLSSAAPLPSSDTTSSQAGMKAETSAGPGPNDQDQLKKRVSKPARATKKPKRERGAKLAIKIQSDVEVLDDGYKWRKYGQKPVKNSPYPRSYYKCTDKQCKVKKHVERQAQEPEYVVTTYEGVHNHSRPDQQLQALHSQSDATSHQHDSFQPFVPTAPTHNLSPMELLGLRHGSLFAGDSQAMSLPLQQSISSAPNALEAIDQGILQTLFQGEEPRTSSI
ncbi:hypothetical protein GOP47_0008351 [Adiantum capillus-veneris]|uniref:WRKY domain-containing protein n=1 Tax=Adiantum capillus-veneris TaxID=13818 RepID=A0A9D4ZKC9_ADICA|nr:hypothetical protein GOP47_0008351 [Adiantum capillus-veneris]